MGSTCGFLRHPQQAACAFCVPPCMSSAPCHCYWLLGAWHAGIALLGSGATLLLLRCRFATPAHYVIVFISTALQAMRSASLFLRHCNWWCSRRVNSRCSWSCPHTSHRSGDSAWLIKHVACSISSMALRVLHRLAYIFKGCLYCLWSELRFHFCQRSCSCGRTAVQQLR